MSPTPSPLSPAAIPSDAAGRSRYHALDSLRATAMLLGVFYHSIQFGGGMAAMFGGAATPATRIMDWIHHFRMPLFFLISGFFSHMMFAKYGWGRYLGRRWGRIVPPLLVTLFGFAIYHAALPQRGPFGGGPGGPGGPGRGPGGAGGPPAEIGDRSPFPPGFIPPPLQRFDKNKDGTLSDAEWKEAQADMRKMFAAGPGPQGGPGRAEGPGGFRPPGFGEDEAGDDGDDFGPPPGFGGTNGFQGGPPPGFGPPRLGGPGGPPGMGGRGGPGGPGGFPFGRPSPLSAKIFGDFSRQLNLGHLWFLWYLLVFLTLAPAVAAAAGWAAKPLGGLVDTASRRVLQLGLGPVALAAVALPGLLQTSTMGGWTLGGATGIFDTFPDTLYHYQVDWPFYFGYFLVGWWLFRMRSELPSVARLWLPTLAAGFVVYAAAVWMNQTYSRRTDLAYYPELRLAGYALFALGAAATSFGLLGLFQRFFDRPGKVGRYLADTALWVYLVHQEILTAHVLGWVRPWNLPLTLQAIVSLIITIGIALALFEAVVRRTPLVYLFGPAQPKTLRPQPTAPVPAA